MFSWLKRSKTTEETRGQLANPEDWLVELFGAAPNLAGVSVSPANAMRATPVRCAVLAISETLGSLPLLVYRRQEQAKERAREHPSYKLLHDRWNDWTPASEARETWVRQCLLWGNSFAFLNRASDGQVREIINLEPGVVSVEVDERSREPIYKINQGSGVGQVIPRQNILHLRAPGHNGIVGKSPVTECRAAIAVCLVLENHCATFFGRSGRPDGILSTDQRLTTDAITRMGKVWRACFGGGKSGGTPILDQNLKYTALSFNSVDSQLLELRKFCVDEVARIWRVPPHLLFSLDRATWSNAEVMGRAWLQFGLSAWIGRVEGEINLKLFGEDERDQFFAEYLLEDLVKADLQQRFEAYNKAISSMWMTPAEVRERENLPFREGTDKFVNPNTTSGPAQ